MPDFIKCFRNWKMIINTTKTKCITFQQKNKLNKTELFTVENCILSNVCEFTCLGIKINALGSFKSTPKFLGRKANRVCFALNNHLKVRDIPVVIALKLFDATVLPMVPKSGQLLKAMQYGSWDLGLIEQVYLNFCKHILGVNRSTTNLLCRAELGRRPIKLVIALKILQFFKHCLELSDDKLVKEALKADGDLYMKHDTIKIFSKYISDTETVFGNDFSQLPKVKQKAKLLEIYHRIWASKVVRSSKDSAYFIFKKTITYEPYLSLIRYRKHRVSYTKLRLSDHPLMIEAGRHFKFKIQQEERICPLCNNGAYSEDEIHFVMKCTQFEELRAKMLQLVENKYVAFKSLNDEQKLFYLFTNEDKEVCRGISDADSLNLLAGEPPGPPPGLYH